jgi:hypothetical protein
MPLYRRNELQCDRLLGGIIPRRKSKEDLSWECFFYLSVSSQSYIILDSYGNQLRDTDNSDFFSFGKNFFHSEFYDTL